jgi:hypothetical protein
LCGVYDGREMGVKQKDMISHNATAETEVRQPCVRRADRETARFDEGGCKQRGDSSAPVDIKKMMVNWITCVHKTRRKEREAVSY